MPPPRERPRRGESPFRLISAEGPCSYDPLIEGSVDERAERLIEVEDWGSADADFYRQASSPFLRLLIEAMDAAKVRTTLRSVAERCDPKKLGQLATGLAGQAAGQGGAQLHPVARGGRPSRGRRAEGSAVQSLAVGLRAVWLDPEVAQGHVVDLRASVRECEVVYFRLDTDRTGNVGRAIAQMAMLDLGATASSMMGNGVGTLIAIDEFGALSSSGDRASLHARKKRRDERRGRDADDRRLRRRR